MGDDRSELGWQTVAVKRRSRRISLRIGPDGSLKVGAPPGTSRRLIRQFVDSKRDWIRQQRASQDELYDFGAKRQLAEGLSVSVVPGPTIAARIVGEEQIIVTAPPGATGWEIYSASRGLIKLRLNQLAQAWLPGRLEELAGLNGLRPQRIAIRFMRSRWGSCNASGKINLNSQLLRLPPRLSDYVLLHELNHLVVRDHSEQFHRHLQGMLPGTAKLQAELRRHRLLH